MSEKENQGGKPEVHVTRIDGPLPDGLAQVLGEVFGEALGDKPQPKRPVPATKEQALVLIEAAKQEPFQVGDIVKLREHAFGRFKWPTATDECIVTQALREPFRSTEHHGSPVFGMPQDFAIVFYDTNDGQLIEHMHDSRNFVKVGSIFDQA